MSLFDNQGVVYQGEMSAKMVNMETLPATYKDRLDREAKQLQFRLDRVNKALAILARHPDIEELLSLLQ